MQKLLAFLLALAITGSASAAETWKLVWVARSGSWFIKEGAGELERRDGSLVGTLVGTDGVSKYAVNIKLNKDQATGTFEVIPGDAGRDKLKGTYRSNRERGENNCWETIQLHNGYNYVGLLRNTTCEP